MLGRRLAPQSQPIEIVGLLFARKSIRRQGARTKLNYLMSLHASSRNIGLRSFCRRYVVIRARTVTPLLAEGASG